MPEGHVIHSLAQTLTEHFADRTVEVSSPQGRFASSAARVDGTVLAQAEAWGKHLFIKFDNGEPDHLIHIHLGLIGKLRFSSAPIPGQIRLQIAANGNFASLTGPQTCRLISRREWEKTISRLGPDPLRADAEPERGWARINRSTRTIASLLMDQSIAAGVGNIYRAEVLFRNRILPSCPGVKLKRKSWEAIWADLVKLMAYGRETGRIDTVCDEHLPEKTGRSPRVDPHGGEVYVYRRAGEPCLVCGSKIRSDVLEGRNMYWCGRCQRRH